MAEALKDVVVAVVVVPVHVAGALELEAELEPLPDATCDVRVVDGEGELVGEPIA